MTLVTNTGKNVNDLSRLGLVASSVVDWGIGQASLEDVFLNIVRKDEKADAEIEVNGKSVPTPAPV